MASNNVELIEFYGGHAVLEKKPWKEFFSFRRQGEKKTLLSVTRIAKNVDKGNVLINWAIGLTANAMRSAIEKSPADKFGKEELMLLIDEAARKPEEAKIAGADIGKIIHEFAHDFAKAKIKKTEEPSLDHLDEDDENHAKALNGISAFLDWHNGNKVKFVEMEKLFYYHSALAGDSKKKDPIVEYYGFADLVAQVNGKLCLIDYKSSKGVYSEQQYQVSALRNAAREFYEIEQELIVNFNKETGDLITYEIPDEDSLKNRRAFFGQYHVAQRERELSNGYKKK